MLELFTKASLLLFSLTFLMVLWSTVVYDDPVQEPDNMKLVAGYMLLGGMVFGVLGMITLIITW